MADNQDSKIFGSQSENVSTHVPPPPAPPPRPNIAKPSAMPPLSELKKPEMRNADAAQKAATPPARSMPAPPSRPITDNTPIRPASGVTPTQAPKPMPVQAPSAAMQIKPEPSVNVPKNPLIQPTQSAPSQNELPKKPEQHTAIHPTVSSFEKKDIPSGSNKVKNNMSDDVELPLDDTPRAFKSSPAPINKNSMPPALKAPVVNMSPKAQPDLPRPLQSTPPPMAAKPPAPPSPPKMNTPQPREKQKSAASFMADSLGENSTPKAPPSPVSIPVPPKKEGAASTPLNTEHAPASKPDISVSPDVAKIEKQLPKTAYAAPPPPPPLPPRPMSQSVTPPIAASSPASDNTTSKQKMPMQKAIDAAPKPTLKDKKNLNLNKGKGLFKSLLKKDKSSDATRSDSPSDEMSLKSSMLKSLESEVVKKEDADAQPISPLMPHSRKEDKPNNASIALPNINSSTPDDDLPPITAEEKEAMARASLPPLPAIPKKLPKRGQSQQPKEDDNATASFDGHDISTPQPLTASQTSENKKTAEETKRVEQPVQHYEAKEDAILPHLLTEILRQHKIWLDSDGREGKRANLYGEDLRHADLRGADLRSVNMRGAILDNLDLSDACFEDADLAEASLKYIHAPKGLFQRANLAGSDFEGATLEASDLSYTEALGANFFSADLQGVVMQGANLRDANFAQANMSYACMTGAFCRGVNLSDTLFNHADLMDVELREAYCYHTQFISTNLSGASFKDAHFEHMSFSESDFTVAHDVPIEFQNAGFQQEKESLQEEKEALKKLEIELKSKQSEVTQIKLRMQEQQNMVSSIVSDEQKYVRALAILSKRMKIVSMIWFAILAIMMMAVIFIAMDIPTDELHIFELAIAIIVPLGIFILCLFSAGLVNSARTKISTHAKLREHKVTDLDKKE